MGEIIFNIIIMSVVGALSGAVIKFLQWAIADVTFGILLGFPTSESIAKLIFNMYDNWRNIGIDKWD